MRIHLQLAFAVLALGGLASAQCQGNFGAGHLSSSPMALGSVVTITVSGNPGAPAMLFVAATPGPMPVPGFGTVCLDAATLTQFASLPLNSQGQAALPFGIPNDPAFLGILAFMQGVVGDATAPFGLALTEGLRVQFAAQDSYVPVQSMGAARALGAAVTLKDGRAFLTGGGGGSLTAPSGNASTEIFEPVTRTYSAGPALSADRGYHTATVLNDGRVLIAGGVSTNSVTLDSCEIYDPVTNTISAAAPMPAPRAGHTATLLGNGKVLVAGGGNNFVIPVGGTFTSVLNAALETGAVYDPAANTWMPVNNVMAAKRFGAAAVRLNDGRALITSGISGTSTFFGITTITFTATTSYYDPATNNFTAGPSIGTGRAFHSAATLPDGRVFVAAGVLSALIPAISNTTRVLSGSTFAAGPNLAGACAVPTLVVLRNGALEISGGMTGDFVAQTFGALSSVARYVGTALIAQAALPIPMGGQYGCLLRDGSVLHAGGADALGAAQTTSFIHIPVN